MARYASLQSVVDVDALAAGGSVFPCRVDKPSRSAHIESGGLSTGSANWLC